MTTPNLLPPVDRWAAAGPNVLRLVILAATTGETLVWVYICVRLLLDGTRLVLIVPASFAFVAMTLSAMVMAYKNWRLQTAATLATMSAVANWHLLSRLP